MDIVRRTAARAAYAQPALALGIFLVLAGTRVAAQGAQASQANALSFEVASVRTNISGGVNLSGPRSLPGGSVMAPNVSLRTLIAFAYGLDLLYERIEGKSDLLDQNFDVMAKAGSDVPPAQLGKVGPVNVMMQSLLAERFKLAVRLEERQQRGYALVTARTDGSLGPGIRASDLKCRRQEATGSNTAGDTRSCSVTTMNNEFKADGADMVAIARTLSLTLGQPVVDRTGLLGTFAVRMTFDLREIGELRGLQPRAPEGAGSNLPSLFTALKEQLGLKLEPERVPARVLIVEHVEPPTPN